jgi:hypothetical protein
MPDILRLTLLSWPPLASNFPSDEKWQQTTLLALALTELTSVNVNPEVTCKFYTQSKSYFIKRQFL